MLVLPEWIEHSTSPLPRGCSTTELRQLWVARDRDRAGANAAETAKSPLKKQGKGRACLGSFAVARGAMADDGKGGKSPGKSGVREARLAAALRENLKRRKQQERARAQNNAPEPRGEAPPKERPR